MEMIKVTYTIPCREKHNCFHEYQIIDKYNTFTEAFEDARDFMNFMFNNVDVDVDKDSVKILMEVL